MNRDVGFELKNNTEGINLSSNNSDGTQKYYLNIDKNVSASNFTLVAAIRSQQSCIQSKIELSFWRSHHNNKLINHNFAIHIMSASNFTLVAKTSDGIEIEKTYDIIIPVKDIIVDVNNVSSEMCMFLSSNPTSLFTPSKDLKLIS